MSKINRLAVLLIGEFRTWETCAESMFKHAQKKSLSVDYYFVTWAVSGQKHRRAKFQVTDEAVRSEFLKFDQNLVDYRILPVLDQDYGSSFFNAAYLAKVANTLKRRHELAEKFVYDQVIEIRPDVFLSDTLEESNIQLAKEFECIFDSVLFTSNDLQKIHFPEANDLRYQTDSFTNDVMSNRFEYEKFSEYLKFDRYHRHWPHRMLCHWLILDYIYHRRLQSVVYHEDVGIVIIRPNVTKHDLSTKTIDELQELHDIFWRTNER